MKRVVSLLDVEQKGSSQMIKITIAMMLVLFLTIPMASAAWEPLAVSDSDQSFAQEGYDLMLQYKRFVFFAFLWVLAFISVH